MKLKDMSPADYNPREMTEEAEAGLEKSLSRFGLLSVIIYNKQTGNIVGGHQRYKQLLKNNVEETDVVVVDLEMNEEIALNIALNSRHIRGDFTQEAIASLRMAEARLGQVFSDIKLDCLLEKLEKASKRKEQKKEKKEKDTTEAEQGMESFSDTEGVINCPNCHSKWRMSDNQIIQDAFTGKESSNGG